MADDEFSITALVTAAGEGDQLAWNDIVDRYSPLLVGVLRHCQLTSVETEDVAQTVWLRLVEHLDSLREARALPMWIIHHGPPRGVAVPVDRTSNSAARSG
jgi:DNA-directed RNA polymerase specialized sigma24 family protein